MFIKFKCPHCGASLQDMSDLAGKTSTCPRCKKTIVVPERESAAQVKYEKRRVKDDIPSLGERTAS